MTLVEFTCRGGRVAVNPEAVAAVFKNGEGALVRDTSGKEIEVEETFADVIHLLQGGDR